MILRLAATLVVALVMTVSGLVVAERVTILGSTIAVSGSGIESNLRGVPSTVRRQFLVHLLPEPIVPGAGATYDARSLSVSVHVRAPHASHWNSVQSTVYDRKDGTAVVNYQPAESGRYRITVKWNGSNVPNSPFTIPHINAPGCCVGKAAAASEFEAAYRCDRYNLTSDEQLTRDMERWERTGVELKHLPTDLSVSRHYTILNNELHVRGSTQGLAEGMIEPFLLTLLRLFRVPDTEFVLNYADMPMHRRLPWSGRTSPFAVFGWCGHASYEEMMLPTWETMQFASSRNWDTAAIDEFATSHYPWHTKIEKVFWRGGDFGNNGRRPFVDIARQHTDLMDAGFYYAYAHDPAIHGPLLPSVSFHDFFKFKYVMNVDGAAAAYRLPFLFVGGSLILWQSSPFYEHIYWQFKPNVHYLPVKRDFSDLLSQIEWARTHDAEARAIATAGQALARTILTPEQVYCYSEQALVRYTRALKFKPEIRSGMVHVPQPAMNGRAATDCQCRPAPAPAPETASTPSAAAPARADKTEL